MNWPDRGPPPMRAYSVTCSSAILRTMALSELFLVNCCGPLSGRLASLANHVFANDEPPSCVSSLAFLINLVTQSPAGATSAIPAQTQHSDSGSIIRFFDRAAELEEMARSLASSPLVILRGVAGVGKTLLATVYADRHKSDYQMVLLVPASQPASIASQFSAFLAESGGRPASRRSVVASGTICSSWRRRLPITTSVRTRSSRLMSVVPSQQWCRATIQSSSR